MPSKYIVRNFSEGVTYHIYNKSVDTHMFQDEDDYRTFLFYIYIYLKPLKQVLNAYPTLPFRLQIKNMSEEIDAFGYCLLPDHFHLLLRQSDKDSIPRFMKQVNNAYTEYYNKKYKRFGRLMHGRYRAAALDNDNQILELSRFIHYHPEFTQGIVAENYQWSSFREYLDRSQDSFCNKRLILSFFSSPSQYKDFVADTQSHKESFLKVKPQIIEKDIFRG